MTRYVPVMRIAPLFSSPMIAAALSAVACGGSAPPPTEPAAAPTTADPAPEATASDVVTKPAASDARGEVMDDESSVSNSAPRDGVASDKAASDQAGAGAKGPETRTMDVIRKLVMENRKAARKCYEDARLDSKDLQGNVVIHFVLDPEGKVKSAELNQERSTLKTPAVVDCVVRVIKGIQFPKSSRAMETAANYPFNFTP